MFLIKFTFIDGVDIIENCHEYYVKKEKIDAIKLSSLTKEISFLFEQHNIPYLVLKGIPLSIQTTGYESSRGLGDLDILIDKSNLKKSIRLLKKYNFEFT